MSTPTCSGCKEEIDPDVCWCGDLMNSHTYSCGHMPVPLGCRCFYSKPDDLSNLDIDLS